MRAKPWARGWNLGLVLGLGLCGASCFIDVPDPDSGEFVCDSNEDCAEGYACGANGICVGAEKGGNGESDPCGGCSADSECIRFVPDGPWGCVPAARDLGASNYTCDDDNVAYIEAMGYHAGSDRAMLAVCKPCMGCGAERQCRPVLTIPNHGYFEQISVGCFPKSVTQCSECGANICASLTDTKFFCMPDCIGCTDNQVSCPEVSAPGGSANGCVQCPRECAAGQECAFPFGGSQPLLNRPPECRYPNAGCDTTACQVDYHCVKYHADWTSCLKAAAQRPDESLYCPEQNDAFAEVVGLDVPAYAVCVVCTPPCGPGEKCRNVGALGHDAGSPGYLDDILVECRPE